MKNKNKNIFKKFLKNNKKNILGFFSIFIFIIGLFSKPTNISASDFYSFSLEYPIGFYSNIASRDKIGILQNENDNIDHSTFLGDYGIGNFRVGVASWINEYVKRSYTIGQTFIENYSSCNWSIFTTGILIKQYDIILWDTSWDGRHDSRMYLYESGFRLLTYYYGDNGAPLYLTTDTDYILYNKNFTTFELVIETRVGKNSINDGFDITRYKIYLDDVLFWEYFLNSPGFNPKYCFTSYIELTSTDSIYIDDGNLKGNYKWGFKGGCRIFHSKGQTEQDTDEFLDDFPRFKDSMGLFLKPPEQGSTMYWEYASNQIRFDTNKTLEVGINTNRTSIYNENITIVYEKWIVDYPLLTMESHTARYYLHLIDIEKSWGDWGIFNFARDVLGFMINLVILIIDFFGYCLILAFNWILIWLIIGIIGGFLWNFLIFWSLYGILWIVWFLALIILIIWEFIIWIFVVLYEFLLWLWNSVIVPFFSWFIEWFFVDFLPILIDVIILIIASIIALFFFLITLGSIDFFSIQSQVFEMLVYVADFFIESFIFFILNIPSFLLYFLWYLILIGLIYGKYYYCKSKGYVNRTEQLYSTFEAYILPLEYSYTLLIKIKNVIPMI